MILKNFIFNICEDVQSHDDELVRTLLREKISYVEGLILDFTNLIVKTFTTTVTSSLLVRLPYDFRYPLNIKINGVVIYRYEKNQIADAEETYSINTKRIVPASDRRLILKPSEFEYLNIETRRSDEEVGYGFKLLNDDDSIVFGESYDNQNIFYPENIANGTPTNCKIKVYDSGDAPAIYQDIERIEDNDVLEILTIYGLYKIKLKNAITEYYLAENGFTYSDALMTTLLTRGELEANNLYIDFNSISEDDTVEIEYVASEQRYINENQVDVVLDTFKNLVHLGTVWQAYKWLKKERKSLEAKQDFYDALKLAEREAGKIKNFGKQKSFNFKSNTHVYRLPFQR